MLLEIRQVTTMTKTSKKSNLSKGNSVVRFLLFCFLLSCIIISVYPFIYMLIVSFMDTTTMRLDWERIAHAKYTIENYKILFREMDFVTYFTNSTIMTVYAVVVTCLTAALAAYGFAKKKFRGRTALYLLYLATMMIPSQVTLIPCFLILKTLGMLNTFSAMVLPTVGAFGVLLMYSFMGSVPNDLLEAADLDGCGEIKKFTQIVLPLIKPVIISLAIFTFISVWSSLTLPLIVSTKSEMTTLTVAIANMKNQITETKYGLMMAGSAVSFMPPFILYLILQKQFVEGIALSGTKL